MSKLGKKPINLKQGVEIKKEGQKLTVVGPLGELSLMLPAKIKVEVSPESLKVDRLSDDKKTRALHGTFVRLINNAIEGTTIGFSKVLEVVGTGFRVQQEEDGLVFSLGFSHPVKVLTPEGIKFEVGENKVKVSGVDKEKVGLVADRIRRLKKPDPYKGKGVRYLGEKLKLKPGKAAAKTGASAAK